MRPKKTNKNNRHISKELNIQLYKELYLIRRTEERICEYYPEDEMKTPMHMSMGEEAIAVGVCHALKKGDQVFATYRSHAAFLAKTGDTDSFFAEMYAKETSPLKGKSGSMHLCSPIEGFMGASAIVAAHIPVAVGCAFANKSRKNEKVVVVFFGDGAVDEGGFWESINTACLMKLPVFFVCEDNGLAVHTSSAQRRGYSSIARIISGFDCRVLESDSTDAQEVYNLSLDAVGSVRKESRPCFINLKYYRYLEHVGTAHDFDAGYRSKDEFDKWRRKDPLLLQRNKLLSLGVSSAQVKKIEGLIDKKVSVSILKAKDAPFSGLNELHKGVI